MEADGRGAGVGGSASASGGRSLRARGAGEGAGPSSATAQQAEQGQQAGGAGMQGPAPPKKYGYEVVGKRVRVYWKEQRTYYSGVVLAFDSKHR